MTKALLVAATASDAGKSVVCAGLLRWLSRQGLSVAPFKAQNMALNSAVTCDGREIGRAQVAQAQAAMQPAEAAMNPILIKPSSDRQSQVMVMGRPLCVCDAGGYQSLKGELRPAVHDALADLLERFDVVICEGAGSPAEINLRHTDLANMDLARAFDIPVVLVADIDRGGAFASLYGSVALLDQADQRLIQAFVLNKFRGDPALLESGIATLTELTQRPTIGVLPWAPGIWLDAEDSLDLDGRPAAGTASAIGAGLDVCVARLPRMSNFTDFDALACEPGVSVRFSESATDIERCDLAVLPGTKATVSDLGWIRERGIDSAFARRAASGSPVFAICGGYQMLTEQITDAVESKAGAVAGLGLVPATTVFADTKALSQRRGVARAFGSTEVAGYEIRHGEVYPRAGRPLFTTADSCEGLIWGSVAATSWHGVLECDAFRRALLGWVADLRARSFEPAEVSFAQVRERRIDTLADLIEQNLDTDALLRLVAAGPREGLCHIDPKALACSSF